MKTRLFFTSLLAFTLGSCQSIPSASETNPDGTPKPAAAGFWSSTPFQIAYFGKNGFTGSVSNKTGITLAIDKRGGK